jgi:H+-translocating NAD(P) transhydrogenase
MHAPRSIPAGVLLGGYAAAHLAGFSAEGVDSAAYLGSSALCIAAIACLSNQSTARTGVRGL